MRPERAFRLLAVLITMALLVPQVPAPPAAGGTIRNDSESSFSKGTLNNTTVLPEGVVLKSPKFDPYNWTCVGNCSPASQWHATFDYDSVHGTFLMIGRSSSGGGIRGTWIYDSRSDIWTKINDNNTPPGYSAGGGVFDTLRGEMIVPNYDASQTWTFNKSTCNWSNKNPPTSPTVGSEYALAFDADRGEAVIFGGTQNTFNNETWCYNPSTNTWTKKTPTVSPSARSGACMVYDSANKVFVLVGGTGHGICNDTWTYDPGSNTWTNMSPAGPGPILQESRIHFAMAYHRAMAETVLYGGFYHSNDVSMADTWTYNYTNNIWTNRTPKNSPPPRYGHSMAYDPVNDKMVFVGGEPQNIYLLTYNWRADSWTYDHKANEWTMGTLHAPSAREYALIAYDSDTGEYILFGGSDGTLCGDTWKYNLSLDRWTLLSPTKSCQQIAPQYGWSSGNYGSGTIMAYDRRCKEMVLFNPEGKDLPTTYSYNVTTNTWTDKKPANSPPKNNYLAMTYHERSGLMVLYDSKGYDSPYFYTYNLSSNTWTSKNTPFGLTDKFASLAYLDSTGEILYFGQSGETWIYNLTVDEWTKLWDANSPSPRMNFAMAYDNSRDEVIMYGGKTSDSTPLCDTHAASVKQASPPVDDTVSHVDPMHPSHKSVPIC